MKTPPSIPPLKWTHTRDRVFDTVPGAEKTIHLYRALIKRSAEDRVRHWTNTDAVQLNVVLTEVDDSRTTVLLEAYYALTGQTLVFHENTYALHSLKDAVRDAPLYQRNLVARVTVELQRQARRWEEMGQVLDRVPKVAPRKSRVKEATYGPPPAGYLENREAEARAFQDIHQTFQADDQRKTQGLRLKQVED
jgi:hypothetical protein